MQSVNISSPNVCCSRFAHGVSSRFRISRRVRAVSDESSTSSSSIDSGTKETPAQQVPSKKSAGSGFGDSTRKPSAKKSLKGKPDGVSKTPEVAPSSGVKRRPAPTQPLVSAGKDDSVTQQSETVVEIVLLGFIFVILVEGLALAASGFLPEEWDEFLVKVVYPSFTPTVGVFVVCAAGYGLYKYLSNENKS